MLVLSCMFYEWPLILVERLVGPIQQPYIDTPDSNIEYVLFQKQYIFNLKS